MVLSNIYLVIGRKTLSRRVANKFYKMLCKGSIQNHRKNGDATVLSAEAENDIVLWLNAMRKEGCPVSVKML
ncbi:Hypothetical protein PHPALM_20299 [Phytophthora palmivora]|uniref:HTH CENPB-type domain-containing protein n=1 Tax=Phytophthora palmivora TaxID=4796 RepID=A0A2P4XF74_9STRA|nr:Hypothetical protein PHPALM_20299 [Phytophthora palmivora]